jgi:hypothetical protein
MSIHETVDHLEEIANLLAAGHTAAAQLSTEAALMEAREEAAQYENHCEAEAAAEEAWLAHIFSPEQIAYLESTEDVPF